MRAIAPAHVDAHVFGLDEDHSNKRKTGISSLVDLIAGLSRWSAVVRGAVDTGCRRNHTAGFES
jgi:hypothetical protein